MQMPAEPKPDLPLEIAHVLLIDVVGYSKLLVDEQIKLLQELNHIVRETKSFRTAEASGKLIRVPMGDGMALLFFRSPEEPVQCALEISRMLQDRPHIQVRMGIHSGPVNQVTDVNDNTNIAGSGINVAQRVLECGDARHILLSAHVAEDLSQYRHWQPYLHDLGECEVKHGLRLHLFNVYKDNLGNPQVPEKLKQGKRSKQASAVRPITSPRWSRVALIATLLVSALALVISSLIVFHRTSRSPTTSTRPEATNTGQQAAIPQKSIAVLPFENLSDDKENAYFADGVQDEILTNLAKIADLKIISRTSVRQYKSGIARNLPEISRQLGIAQVVEGSVQRSGNRVRVNARLVDARGDRQLWGQSYDRDLADIFAIQSEIAKSIANQLEAKISAIEKAAIEERPTRDLVAYDLYVRASSLIDEALYYGLDTEKNLFQAVELLNQAIARDQAFLLAYCKLAEAHDGIYWEAIDRTLNRLDLAQSAINSAFRLRPDSGEAHLAQAVHFYNGYLDYDRARDELAIAVRTMPNNARIFEWRGYIDRRQGRWNDSARDFERAIELDPQNRDLLFQTAFTYICLREYKRAREISARGVDLESTNNYMRLLPGWIDFHEQADTEPWHATLERIVTEDPASARDLTRGRFFVGLYRRDPSAADRALAALGEGTLRGRSIGAIEFSRAYAHGLATRMKGDIAGAQAAFSAARQQQEKIVRAEPNDGSQLCFLGLIDAGLDRKEEALREGRRAVELLPVTKDGLNGADILYFYAVICACSGEHDLAIEQLETLAKIPAGVSYGDIRLDPFWDPLRGDPRFEKIVASLASKPRPFLQNDFAAPRDAPKP
jgi:TolB-like protein/class 3 adenylate cyclase/Tfp pilus assembly protein PilF